MSSLITEMERVEHRILGALRCVDASTGARVDAPLQLSVSGAKILRNRSGLYILHSADALAAHAAAFDAPPPTPDIGDVKLTASVIDLSGRYIARFAKIALPRDPLAAHATNPDSLFRPQDIALYPASTATTGANWACLRVSVRDQASGDALGGALLRVTQGATVLARGLSDWRGEALVCVPGVPVTTWSDDPDAVVISEINVQLEVVFDPASGLRTLASDVGNGHAPAQLPQVDPDFLEANRSTLPHDAQSIQIAAGRVQTLSLPLALP